MSLLVDFVDIGPGMIEAVGGKALNLGVLSRAGLPVPTGYCLTTTAYRDGGGRPVGRPLRPADQHADPEALARAAAEARDRVRAIPVPSELRERIVERYHAMPEGPAVAVRSSATAEDLAYASFAGQQDTYLNVIGDDALIEAIQGCWASLWTDRAVSYRMRQRHRPPQRRARRGRAADGRGDRGRGDVHRQSADRHPAPDGDRRQPGPG